jgi:hypothetical protein
MSTVRSAILVVILGFITGIAQADPILTINLPVINGIPTLAGAAGTTLTVYGTIDTGEPLILDSLDISVSSVSGDLATVDPSVYFDPANPFFNTLPAGTTTGALVQVTFAADAPAITEVFYQLQYEGMVSPFAGFFYIATETPEELLAPEPGSAVLLCIGLALALARQRRGKFNFSSDALHFRTGTGSRV